MEPSLSSLHEPHHFSPNLGFRTVNPILNNASRRRNLKLGFRSNSTVSVFSSYSKSQPIGSSTTEQDKPAANPVYTPTPPNRDLRTPHSGYHFDGTARKFFEGWYFKVSIPDRRQSFCFMYSVENPAFRKRLTPLEVAQNGPRTTGVGAQILGAGDKYICQYSEESGNFWGSRHELMLGNTFVAQKQSKPPNKEVPPQEFDRRVMEGFQVTPLWHQGFIRDDGRSDYVETVSTARWEYSTRPIFGWGDVGSKQKSTAGWLAAFPVFEPHWQICLAGGLSTGWIEWDGERYEFQNALSYSEKNWGGAFPRKWFWVQCNVFEGASGEVALTAGGGLRQIPGVSETFENAALIGVHCGGKFYEFVPWNGVVSWEIATWGYWSMAAENETHMVELEATTEDPGTTLRAPTSEAGLAPACKDTCFGVLKLQIWERRYDGSKGKMILDVKSNMAAVEVGGGPWFSTWKGKTSTPELLKRAIGAPVDVEGAYNLVPLFKPPGGRSLLDFDALLYKEFDRRVKEGFQVTPLWNQDFIRDDGRSDYVETVSTARWEYSTRPIFGWGDVGSKQKSTAGWLAAFPVFEPHWQICLAGGLSTGWIEWDGERYEFQNAPSYSEKNWGGAFPRKWFWVQCNVFEGASGEVALTAAGGLRQISGVSETFENAALIGVHCGGKFYEFVPWNGVVSWEIATWGYWSMAAENETHMVELEATAQDPGIPLRAPTSEAGLAPACKDTCFGVLKLQMWERIYDGSKGKMILDVKSNMAALEVGGGPWVSTWKGKTSTPEILKRAIRAPVDVEGAYNLVPLCKPPGL